jgi:hypothetical protein
VRIFTANIKHTMRPGRVASDIRHAIHLGGIGIWQEIETKHSKAVLAGAAAKAGLDVHCIETECPITVNRRRWVVERDNVHLMHKGRFLITPHRVTSEVRAHRRSADHAKLCVLATHMLSSAWSTRAMSTRKWRRRMWHIHYRKLQALIRRAHEDGYTVIVGLDANKGVRSMRFHPDQIIVSAHGIDGIIVVPAKGTRTTHGRERVIRGLFTDHDPVTVDVTLATRRRRAPNLP